MTYSEYNRGTPKHEGGRQTRAYTEKRPATDQSEIPTPPSEQLINQLESAKTAGVNVVSGDEQKSYLNRYYQEAQATARRLDDPELNEQLPFEATADLLSIQADLLAGVDPDERQKEEYRQTYTETCKTLFPDVRADLDMSTTQISHIQKRLNRIIPSAPDGPEKMVLTMLAEKASKLANLDPTRLSNEDPGSLLKKIEQAQTEIGTALKIVSEGAATKSYKNGLDRSQSKKLLMFAHKELYLLEQMRAALYDKTYGTGTQPKDAQQIDRIRDAVENQETKEGRELIDRLFQEGLVTVVTSFPKDSSPTGIAGFQTSHDPKNISQDMGVGSVVGNQEDRFQQAGVNEVLALTPVTELTQRREEISPGLIGKITGKKKYRTVRDSTRPVIHNERVKNGKPETLFKLEYSTIDDLDSAYQDYSGRTGNELIVQIALPESAARPIFEQLKNNPALMREMAHRAVIEKAGVPEEDWSQSTDRNHGRLMKPPYQTWAQRKGGRLRTYIQGPEDSMILDPSTIIETNYEENH